MPPAKKWSMNEPWLGARITGPLGTFSVPSPRALNINSVYGTTTNRVASYVQPAGPLRARSWNWSKYSFGRWVPVDLRLQLDV